MAADHDTRSDAQRLYDAIAELSDRIIGLLHQIHPEALYQSHRVLLALQDCRAHLVVAETLLAIVRDARGAE